MRDLARRLVDLLYEDGIPAWMASRTGLEIAWRRHLRPGERLGRARRRRRGRPRPRRARGCPTPPRDLRATRPDRGDRRELQAAARLPLAKVNLNRKGSLLRFARPASSEFVTGLRNAERPLVYERRSTRESS